MDRRIFGIETEYGLTCTKDGHKKLSADEVARYMFRPVVASARSSNVFLVNGARMYLDVGNHPEYATAECDRLPDLLAQERAGDRIIQGLATAALGTLEAEGIDADIFVFKNNVDSAGNSFGCHENYLLGRGSELGKVTSQLLPFLMSRQLICGAGKVTVDSADRDRGRDTDGAASYVLSQRADVMWEGASSATTRSRPMINTRDEPHADAEKYRRLHVIVGDSNMCPMTTLLKVGSTDLVLRMMEAAVAVPDLSPVSQATAIRAMSKDITGRATVATTGAGKVSALNIQRAYHELAAAYLAEHGPAGELDLQVLDLWTRTLDAVESGDLDAVAGEIDWVIKRRLLERYAARAGVSLDDPRIARLDLLYHDLDPARGLYHRLEAAGATATVVPEPAVVEAQRTPPASTRAWMRGRFIAAAIEHGRDYTVDWSHLRLNDEPARTILCRDPFAAQDDRVDRMLQGIARSGGPSGAADTQSGRLW